MSIELIIYKDSYKLVRQQFSIISYWILCIRGCLGWIGYDTLFLTLILNLFIILSIDYTRVNRLFLLVPFLIISMINNKTILGIIDIFAICLILRNNKIESLAKIYFLILFLFVIFWWFLLKTGFLISHRWFDPAKGGESWDYGFVNPNGLGILGFHICCILFLLLYKKNLFISAIITIAISQLFFEMSLCRTAWIGGMILAILTLFQDFKLFRNWMKYPLSILPIILFFATIFLAKKVGSFEFIDILLSGRLSIWSGIINSMGPINWLIGASQSDLTIDGSYAMLLFMGGLILVYVFCILFYRMMINSFNEIKFYLPFILAILACGFMETTFSSCGGLSVIFWYFLINPTLLHSK